MQSCLAHLTRLLAHIPSGHQLSKAIASLELVQPRAIHPPHAAHSSRTCRGQSPATSSSQVLPRAKASRRRVRGTNSALGLNSMQYVWGFSKQCHKVEMDSCWSLSMLELQMGTVELLLLPFRFPLTQRYQQDTKQINQRVGLQQNLPKKACLGCFGAISCRCSCPILPKRPRG